MNAPATRTPLENPIGTDGFEFVEYTAPDPELLRTLFERMGFPVRRGIAARTSRCTGRATSTSSSTRSPDSFGQRFAREHGPSACAMAFRVKDAARAYKRASSSAPKPVETRVGPMELQHPGDRGHRRQPDLSGRSLRRAHDLRRRLRAGERRSSARAGAGLTYIDHLTHNVHRGNMDKWAGFYEQLFNFREIRYFDIEGKKTGLLSRAMTSPCGKIRIPINESQDDKSQIEEYLREYHGEGIQHIALGTDGHLRAPSTRCARTACSSRTRPTPTTKASTRACRGHRENAATSCASAAS